MRTKSAFRFKAKSELTFKHAWNEAPSSAYCEIPAPTDTNLLIFPSFPTNSEQLSWFLCLFSHLYLDIGTCIPVLQIWTIYLKWSGSIWEECSLTELFVDQIPFHYVLHAIISVPYIGLIPSSIFPFWKTIFSLEASPCVEFPPGLMRLMSPLCNSGLSRSNSSDLNKAAAAENSSNAKVSHTQAALHVEGFWMCPKSNQWKLFIFYQMLAALLCETCVQHAKVHLENSHKAKNQRTAFNVSAPYTWGLKGIWDTKGYRVVRQQNWLNIPH